MTKESIKAVCKCGYLLETRPYTTSNVRKTIKCPGCKKQVNIQYSDSKAYVSYKG